MRPPYLSIFILILFISSPIYAEEITDFHSDIYINKDGTVYVEENINYDFQHAYRHGIYRDIPYEYKLDYKNYNLKIDVDGVTNLSDAPYQYKATKSGGMVKIRIGDPEKKITARHGYKIGYFVIGAVQYFDDHDELYWNVTGNEWRVPIKNASAKIYFDEEIPDGIIAKCFTGAWKSTKENCSYDIKASTVTYQTIGALRGGEGLTIVVGLPKGVLKEPSFLSKLIWLLRDNWYISLPFLTFALLYHRWNTTGRDPEGRSVVSVMYEPPEGFTPAEAGTLLDEQAHIIDITSTIIDLAIRGFIKIEEIESTIFYYFTDKDYKLSVTKNPGPDELKSYESIIFNGIFKTGDSIMISDLKDKFYTELPPAKKALYKELIDKKYFPTNPENVRKIYKWIGTIILILSFFLLGTILGKLSLAVSGVLIIIFSRYMPRKTKKGAIANNHLLGFREFIEKAEKDRIEKLAKDDPTLFDRVLPYALVFGLEDKWANAFSDIYREPPNWYHSTYHGNTFSPKHFVNDVGRSLNVMNSTLSSTPRKSSGGSGFSGGGSSGGGFGGGGGGSWS